MQIVIDIPDEQVKKSLEESKYINEDEGAKGSVHIVMLYTNARLEFVDVARKTDFYSCEYKILPKGHGDLVDKKEIIERYKGDCGRRIYADEFIHDIEVNVSTIIEADRSEEDGTSA